MQSASPKRRLYAALSLLMIAPCFWQPRVHGGDLSTHMYNAWLAQSIESGRADGMQVVSQTTDVLFNLLLGWLYVFGAEWAQRIAVSVAVLILVWGAWAFVRKVSGAEPWHLLPCIAMLAYGWVFHMGFFSFYLSLGLCFWAISLAWTPSRARLAGALALLASAYTAHALPVFWTCGVVIYLLIARNLAPRRRAAVTAALSVSIAGAHLLFRNVLVTRWAPNSALPAGADPFWAFDAKYYVLLAVLLAVWGLLFLALVRCRGPREVVGGLAFQLCVIAAALVIILPETVLLPAFAHGVGYVAERMSLGVAVCICALLGAAPPRVAERWGLVAVAVVFFGFVYRDERTVNAFEDRMQHVVSGVLPNRRPAVAQLIRPGAERMIMRFQTTRPPYQ